MFDFFKKLRKDKGNESAPLPAEQPVNEPASVPYAPEDIRLFSHSVQGYSQNGPVHLGTSAHFHIADQTVYIEKWGPNGTTVEQYAIPEHVGKTGDEINQYLSQVEHVHIPGELF